jgi:hypothetical protein
MPNASPASMQKCAEYIEHQLCVAIDICVVNGICVGNDKQTKLEGRRGLS